MTTQEIVTSSITIIAPPKRTITHHTEDRLEMTIINTARTTDMEETMMDGETILTVGPEKTIMAQEDKTTMTAITYPKGTIITQIKTGDQ